MANLSACARWLLGWAGLLGLAVTGAETSGPALAGLTAEEQKLVQAGKDLYEVTCLSCHQANGLGQDALAPPLVGSHWVTNSPERLVRLTLHGMRGPVKVKGRVYEFGTEMPPLAVLSDEQIGAVLSYVRREWGHTASIITPAAVARIREGTAQREQPWTEAELLKIP